MTQQINKKITAIALLVAIFIPNVAGAFTIEKLDVEPEGDIVMEPGKQEVFLDAGKSATKSISVTSRIEGTTKFRVSVEDITGSEDPGQTVVLLGDERGPYSIRDMISPEISEFSLELGERITIPIEIDVPEGAEPAGHYGAVIVSTIPDDDVPEGGAATKIVSRLGSIFLVRINGEVNEEGMLEDFRISGPEKLFHNQAPESFEILFRNSGNVHLTPYGIITVKNLLGKEVSRIPVNAYFSLPESLRAADVRWNVGTLIGRYTAELELNRSYGEKKDTAEISFWILPWKIMVFILLIALLIVSLLTFISKRFEIRKK